MAEISPAILDKLERLPAGLQAHVERVREIAEALASHHHVDPDSVDLSAAAHDMARALTHEELMAEAGRLGLKVHAVEEAAPMLLHGPIAAAWLETEGMSSDPAVLEAVGGHTTGLPGMGPVAKVLYLADKLDPYKDGRYPHMERVQSLARQSLDGALLELLGREIVYRVSRGDPIHPGTVGLRNEIAVPSAGNRTIIAT